MPIALVLYIEVIYTHKDFTDCLQIIISRILQISFTQTFLFFLLFSFSFTNVCLFCRACKACAWPIISLSWIHLNTMILTALMKILKNLEYFLRNDFLILRDSLIICVYLSFFKENRLQAFSWSERHMSLQLKITKTGFGPIIKYISGPFNEFLLLERNLLF